MHYTLNVGQTESLPFGTSGLPVWAEDSSRREFSSHVQKSLFLSEKMDSLADKYLGDETAQDLTFYLILKANTSSLAFVLNEIFDLKSPSEEYPEQEYSVSDLDTFRLGIHEAERLSSTILNSVALHGSKYFDVQDASGAIRDFSVMNSSIKSIYEKKAFTFTGS